jgi:hypothetical protein
MAEAARSEQACPVCAQHTLAVDEPPRIDVMGVQSYSDIVGMGDLRQAVLGIVCLTCGTHWPDREAFDRNEPSPADDLPDDLAGDLAAELADDDAWTETLDDADASDDE